MKNLNILLVDDSKIIISALESTLADLENVKMIENASNVAMAKQILADAETDLLILDIKLPDGNGIDLLKWTKTMYPQTRVVMFSNNSDDCFRYMAKEYGADYFFDKATEFEQLEKTVSEL